MSIGVLLVDDHAIIREGLRSLFEKQPDTEVLADIDEGRKAVELVRELSPDVVVIVRELSPDVVVTTRLPQPAFLRPEVLDQPAQVFVVG